MSLPGGAWDGGPAVGDLGEFGLIARIRERIPPAPAASGVVLGPGDDAALLEVPPGWDLVLTCDIQIEDRHFRRRWMSPREAGARAAAVNLSDVAAMGGVPTAALVSLGLPPALPIAAVDAMCEGIVSELGRHGATLAGGNISASDAIILDVTVAGRVERGRALRRSGARPGDTVLVTGHPGRAAAALATLDAAGDLWERLAASGPAPAPAPELRERFRRHLAAPSPRVAVGRFLAENAVASAAIDQSDGLTGDLAHIAEESGVRILLGRSFLPIDPELAALGPLVGVDPLDWVLGASDDYEMIFTAPAGKVDLALALGTALGIAVTPIGAVVAGPPGVDVLDADGAPIAAREGWDHLGRGRAPEGPPRDGRN
jgi:thiamine-monophosphate kinase